MAGFFSPRGGAQGADAVSVSTLQAKVINLVGTQEDRVRKLHAVRPTEGSQAALDTMTQCLKKLNDVAKQVVAPAEPGTPAPEEPTPGSSFKI